MFRSFLGFFSFIFWISLALVLLRLAEVLLVHLLLGIRKGDRGFLECLGKMGVSLGRTEPCNNTWKRSEGLDGGRGICWQREGKPRGMFSQSSMDWTGRGTLRRLGHRLQRVCVSVRKINTAECQYVPYLSCQCKQRRDKENTSHHPRNHKSRALLSFRQE